MPSRASPWRPSDLGKATYNPFRPISNHPHWFPYGQDHQHAQFQLFPMGHKSDLWHSRPALSTSVLAIDTSRTWPGPYMSRALHTWPGPCMPFLWGSRRGSRCRIEGGHGDLSGSPIGGGGEGHGDGGDGVGNDGSHRLGTLDGTDYSSVKI